MSIDKRWLLIFWSIVAMGLFIDQFQYFGDIGRFLFGIVLSVLFGYWPVKQLWKTRYDQ